METSTDANPGKHLKDVKIIGLQKFESYSACFKCKGKIAVDQDDDEMEQCMRCNMIQCISNEESATMATLTLKPLSGKVITLKAFDKI